MVKYSPLSEGVPGGRPKRAPEGGGLYLTVYPKSSPYTGSIPALGIVKLMIPSLISLAISPYTP